MLFIFCSGINVVLDLTPNYQGSEPWFSNVSVTNVAERLKVRIHMQLYMYCRNYNHLKIILIDDYYCV